MNVKQLIVAALVLSVASTVFAEQGDGPSPSAIARAHVSTKAQQSYAETKTVSVNGKTRAEVRADMKDAYLFSNRNLH
jgi:hypothetical protein